MSKAPTVTPVMEFNGAKVKDLLEKTKHYDADERFMATKDLIDQLKLLSGALEASLQAPIRDTILRLLDDKNSDVSTMAVKCLSQTAQKFSAEHIGFIVDKLTEIMIDPTKSSSRDIVTDGLQTLIASIDDQAGGRMALRITPLLIKGLTQKAQADDVDIEMAGLTITKNLLNRFGNDITEQHSALISALLGLLEHPNDSVRKRASVTLGPLVVVIDDALFSSLMDSVISRIDSSKNPGTYIQSISAICKSAGVKVGAYLAQIVPKLEKFLKSKGKKREDEDEDASQLELWETSLQALEAITLRCPTKVTPYVQSIVQLGMQMSTYDPMYSYEEAGGAKKAAAAASSAWGDDGAGGDDGWGDDGDAAMNDANEEGWDDDEAAAAAVATASSDNSWTVRRAAVGLLAAFIRARSDILKQHYDSLCDHLVSRFKERDSAVKEDILLCTRDLLRESVVSSKNAASNVTEASDLMDDSNAPTPPSFLRTRSSYVTLDLKLPQIVHGCEKLFQAGGLETRTTRAVFALLSELVRVRHGGLDEYLANLMPHILNCIQQSKLSKENEAASDALKLLQSIVELHKFEVLKPYLTQISSVLSQSISAGLESNKAEALGVVASVAKLVRGHGEKRVTQELYQVTFAEFLQKDVPLNIKLATISTLSSLISYNADSDFDCKAVSQQVVPVLLERLDNDTTVQPTLRAITRISNLSDGIDFSLIVSKAAELILLVRKNTHHLRNDVIRAMESLLRRSAELSKKRAAATFNEKQIEAILQEVSTLISDNDLHLTHLVLDLCSTTLTMHSQAAMAFIPKSILPQAIQLVLSPRLQGVALQSLIKFFQACASCPAATGNSSLSYTNLLSTLMAQVSTTSSSGAKLTKSAYAAIAQCISGTTERASDADANATVSRFVSEIVKQKELDEASQIALLVLGEMGRKRDLTSHAGLEAACLKAFDSKDELVRSSAAFALGNIAVGNLSKSLPPLLSLINTKLSGGAAAANHGYLLFAALKEIIANFSTTAEAKASFRPYASSISPVLFKYVDTPSEASRAMVAECVGNMIVIDPASMLSQIEKSITSPNALVRGCLITSLRFCLSPLMEFNLLEQQLNVILPALLKDPDLEVRQQTFLTINAIARVNIEALPREKLYSVILPTLYFETKVKPELVHEVDYGAFKKIIDDGKPLRRSVFQTLQTLLEIAPHRLDLPDFIAAVKQGITDEDDIQVLTYQIFIELARFHGSSLLEIIEQLPKLIMDSVKKNISEAKGKDPEQALTVLRAIVKALLVFNSIPGVELCTQYSHFFKQVCATAFLRDLITQSMQA